MIVWVVFFNTFLFWYMFYDNIKKQSAITVFVIVISHALTIFQIPSNFPSSASSISPLNQTARGLLYEYEYEYES